MGNDSWWTPAENLTTSAPTSLPRCWLFDGKESDCRIILAVKRTVASISLLGCLFIIALIILFKKYSLFSQRLIFYLSLAAMCRCILSIAGDMHRDGPVCDSQAWAGTFFDWAVMSWVCCITFNMYMVAIRETRTERFEWAYHLVCWGVAFFVSLLPFIDNRYGPTGLWCWIVDDWKWRFGIWYCPLFLTIAGLFSAYIYIIVAINKKVKTWEGGFDPHVEERKQRLRENVKPLKWYPVVYLAVTLFPLINRIQNAAFSNPIFGLVLVHSMSAPMQGAVNAVVYGLDKDTRSRLNFAQIKVAIQNWRYQDQSLIREYPTTAGTMQPYHADHAL